MSIDIFSQAKEKTLPTWAKFVNSGDRAKGTYVGRIEGTKDGYGNEQVIYQLLQEDGTIVNVGMGMNKKVLNQEMQNVRFGQIVGFEFKGKVDVKNKIGKIVSVKDFGLFQDPKIVDEKWLKENEGNMPTITKSSGQFGGESTTTHVEADEDFENFGKSTGTDGEPFSSSVSGDDKLAVITKLAADKLGVTDPVQVKERVMEHTGIAFIPLNYDKIITALNA